MQTHLSFLVHITERPGYRYIKVYALSCDAETMKVALETWMEISWEAGADCAA